jgi:4-hydroxy-tetrahydrodipicolinate synthase
MTNYRLTGSMVALITPMLEDGSIDFDCLQSLVEFHIDSGTKAIVSVGTTGESATLDNDEHIEVVKKTVKFANNRIAVIAGTGANSTTEAIELTSLAKDAGANACLLVTPYYNKPTQEGLYQHYKTIAESVDINQILYNVPTRTAVDLSVDTIKRLASIEKIIGVKDATGDLDIAREIVAKCPKDFLLYSGDDYTAVDFILAGGHGGISVTANVVPKMIAKVYNMALNGDSDMAIKTNKKLNNLNKNLFIESNPIPVKWALYRMNKCKSGIRLPLTKLSKEYQSIVEDDLLSLGLI